MGSLRHRSAGQRPKEPASGAIVICWALNGLAKCRPFVVAERACYQLPFGPKFLGHWMKSELLGCYLWILRSSCCVTAHHATAFAVTRYVFKYMLLSYRRSPSYIDLERSWNSLAKKIAGLITLSTLSIWSTWPTSEMVPEKSSTSEHCAVKMLHKHVDVKNMLFSPTVVVRLVSVFLLSGGLSWASCV